MIVKQNNSVLTIEVYKKGTIKDTFFGKADIPIYTEIIKKLFPCNVFFNILNKNQIVAIACLSFYYIDLSCVKKDDQIYSSLLIETIINVQKKKKKNDKRVQQMLSEGKEHFDIIKSLDVSTNIYKNISTLSIVDKIRIFSKNLNGYLIYTNYYIKRICYNYYFYLHFFKGKFYWCFYNDEKDAQVDKNRIDYIKLENVLNVYSDIYNHRYFYIKYKKKNEKKPTYMYLKSVDKDRHIWVNVIHDFLILINNYKTEKKNNKHLKNEKEKREENKITEENNIRNRNLSENYDSSPFNKLKDDVNDTFFSHSLSRSLSHIYSIKNKYLNKKYTVDIASDTEEITRDSQKETSEQEGIQEEIQEKKRLSHIYKDMNKNMYTYSD